MAETPKNPTPAPEPVPAAAANVPEGPPPKGIRGFLARVVKRVKTDPKVKKRLIRIGILVAVLVAAKFGWEMYTTEETDDAFITARVHNISAKVQGNVIDVPVEENQKVKKGDVLIRLDPRDFENTLKSSEADHIRAQKDLERWANTSHFDPSDKLLNNADRAKDMTTEAAYAQAQLNLEYATVVAPVDGRIGTRGVSSGEHLIPGLAVIALVEDKPWIVANFKEAQVGTMRPGQKVTISVDAIPDKTFEGKVDSVSPGSGATFALLPPDNATGNFTKVVQRIPVKIVFDPESVKGYEDRLSAGMSVEVSVRVRF